MAEEDRDLLSPGAGRGEGAVAVWGRPLFVPPRRDPVKGEDVPVVRSDEVLLSRVAPKNN